MKTTILALILGLSLINKPALAFDVPSDSQVKQAVAIAIHPDFEKILKKHAGNISCQPVMRPFQFDTGIDISQDSLSASGKDSQSAIMNSQLTCIRKACELLPDEVDVEAKKLSSDQLQMHKILKDAGLDDQAIAAIMKLPKNNNNKLSCDTSINMQTLAYDMCVAVPYSCN